jgi:hypothetical protein
VQLPEMHNSPFAQAVEQDDTPEVNGEKERSPSNKRKKNVCLLTTISTNYIIGYLKDCLYYRQLGN